MQHDERETWLRMCLLQHGCFNFHRPPRISQFEKQMSTEYKNKSNVSCGCICCVYVFIGFLKHKNEFPTGFQKNSRSSIISSIYFHIGDSGPPETFSVTQNSNFLFLAIFVKSQDMVKVGLNLSETTEE